MKIKLLIALFSLALLTSLKIEGSLKLVKKYDNSYWKLERSRVVNKDNHDKINEFKIFSHAKLPLKVLHNVRCTEEGFGQDTLVLNDTVFFHSQNIICAPKRNMTSITDKCFRPVKVDVLDYQGNTLYAFYFEPAFSSSKIGHGVVLIDEKRQKAYFLSYPRLKEHDNIASNFCDINKDGKLDFIDLSINMEGELSLIGYFTLNFKEEGITYAALQK